MMPVAPLLICLFTAAVLMIFRTGSVKFQATIGVIGAVGHLMASLLLMSVVLKQDVVVLQLGGWQAPYGITFAVDRLSGLMLVVTGIVHLMGSIFAISEATEEHARNGLFPLLQTLVMGVSGAFATGDFFNLYVWYEVMLLSSFALMVIGQNKWQIEGAFKYAVLNFLASSFFLIGLGLLYGVTGTLNMADVAAKLAQSDQTQLVSGAAVLMLLGFAIKSGVFPFYSWLPTAYHLPTFTASAVFAGLLTKVGVYSLFRTFGMVFQSHKELVIPLFLAISVLTMLFGVLGAATKSHTRKILSFHIISQIGYMTLGLAFFTANAMAAAIFYLIHHIVVKTNLFFISGVIQKVTGTEELAKMGGLLKRFPILAGCFLVSGFSLAGIPPLSGFFAKFAIIKAGVELHHWGVVFVGLFVGLLTLYSMTKIWSEAFWKQGPEIQEGEAAQKIPLPMLFVIVTMAIGTLLISLNPQWLLSISENAASGILDPSLYLQAVLGREP